MSRRGDGGEKPFRLRAGASLRADLVRIARHEVDEIVARLERGANGEEAVHEIRKATKRLRALVRLLRDQLGERRFRRENRAFRDTARALSGRRDAAVVAGAIDHLAERFAGNGRPRLFEPVRRAARRDRPARAARATTRPIAAAMRRARTRVERWPIDDGGWRTLAPGLRRIYRQGREAWRTAADEPTDEALHEWRKRVKDLRYVLELLEPLWPEVMEAWADEVDALADRLGEDHDLAMLRRFIVDRLPEGDGADRDAILVVVDAARRALQAHSWTLAARVYESAPRDFARRLAAYWRAWRAETRVLAESAPVAQATPHP